MAKGPMSKMTMNLFGIPYQFPSAVDPRVNEISAKIGKKYTENIILEAPVCTIIPGEPNYLPGSGKDKKMTTTSALLEATRGGFDTLLTALDETGDDDLRLYDFKNNYTEYMKFVNVLCRAGATFLDLTDTINVNSTSYSFQKYDWKNYRWNSTANMSMNKKVKTATELIKSAKKSKKGSKDNNSKTKSKKKSNSKGSEYYAASTKGSNKNDFEMESADGIEGELSDVLTNYNYVQFYVDSDVSPNESLSNTTSESQMKGLFDQGSSTMKEIAFMANSGGIDTKTLNEFAENSLPSLQSGVEKILGNNAIGSALSRIINVGGNILQGSNLIIPDIYQNSQYSKSYSITVHLKSPYGTKLGYYLDIFVPMMHLMALALPRQTSANSYASPFLVKAYVEGIFTCNLGIVDSIQVAKIADSWSVAGLPSEVDVTINITDLYSDLSMTPSSDPKQFVNNSSLVEYLATNCGMSLTAPNFEKKYSNIINTVVSAFTDVPATVKSSVEEKVYTLISQYTSLTKS